MDKPTIVCILGMHRSGTSCLAGSLESHGLYLGETVISAPHNKRGNKENIPLRDLNDKVLHASAGAWDRPPPKLVWNNSLLQQRDEIIASFRDQPIWGFKDPRTMLTLPFWQDSGAEILLIGTFRHPDAVAASLMKRPGLLPATPPKQLWAHYNGILLSLLKIKRFPLINFDWPESRYMEAISSISRMLGLKETAPTFYSRDLKSEGASEDMGLNTDEPCDSMYRELERFAIIP